MNIQVFGSGCTTCKKLHELTLEAVKQLNLNIPVEYVTDVTKIIEMGVMSSPVLAINGSPVMVGYVPDLDKLKQIISSETSPVDIHESCVCKSTDGCANSCDCSDNTKTCTCCDNC